MYDDQPALVADEIRHHSEAVALVAAPDPATARAARAAITLRTESLPPVLDPEASEKAFARYEIAKGDLEAGFAEADLIVEGTYRVGPQEHIYIEPQAMIAAPEDDGGVTVTGSLQCPYYVHAALARAFALPVDKVRVVQAETGGGFGGKEEYPSMLAIHAALLARAAGRPVRMTYDRHEDIAATTKRHPAVIRHRTGVAADGRLVAQEIDVVMDAGAYATLSPVVLSRGAIHATGPVSLPQRPGPGPGRDDEHGPWRGVPRLWRAPDGVRRGDPPLPDRRGAGDLARRAAPAPRLSRGRRHRHGPGAAAERGRDRRPRAGRGGVPVRAGAGAAGPAGTGRRSDCLGSRAGTGLARRGLHGKRREDARQRRRHRADGRRADPDPHRPDRDRPGRRDRPPPDRRGRARGRGRRGRAGAARHGARPEQRADGRLAHDDGGRRPRGWSGEAAPRAGGGTHRATLRGELARRRRGPRPHPGRRSPRGLPRHRVGPGALPRATPTRPTAGRPPWPSSTWTSTPARSPSGASSRSTRPGAS